MKFGAYECCAGEHTPDWVVTQMPKPMGRLLSESMSFNLLKNISLDRSNDSPGFPEIGHKAAWQRIPASAVKMQFRTISGGSN
jgi:hypothetical protein